MKKKTIAVIIVGAVLIVACGGYGIYKIVKNNASPVEVTPVSYLNMGWWGDTSNTSGIITANATQEVYLDGDELVDKVYVEEGDEVKIGDTLLSYDTTLLELDVESEQLERQGIKLQIKAAEQELEKLKKITPIPDNAYGDAGRNDGAVLVRTQAVMTATSAESETSAPQTETPETKTVETAPETQAPETKVPESQTPETISEEVLDPGKAEEPEKSPLKDVKAYAKLNYDSKPYKGSGTKEDPYVFFCKEGATIYASFMNKMLGYNASGTSKSGGGMKENGKGSYAILEIREGDSVKGGFVKSISINGTVKVDKAYAPDITWTFASDGVTKNVPDVDEPADDGDDDPFGDDWGGDFGDDVYTVTELKEAIKEKEDEIKDLKIDLREAKLNVKQAERKLDEAIVKATINGVVKSVGDPAVGEIDGEPFMTVTSSEGMYVEGTISELKLGDVKVGTTMTGMSYESGTSFTAEITEISEYPTTANSWSSNDAAASSYPFMAYIEDSTGLSNNEWVDLTIQESAGEDSSAIYLPKAYIRSENGQSYVYKSDENGRLKKQYIKTGVTVYSTNVEIKSGLSLEDKIAFPYGKNVVEGAKVKDDESADDAMMY